MTTRALPKHGRALPAITPLSACFAVALVLGIAARVLFNRTMPLWFDETFTATLATQPNVPALIRWCLTELTGPAFYAPMWAWVQMFGASDTALRGPALILCVAAPLLLARWGSPDRTIRLMWAGALLLWLPALPFANDARPYAQLVFLGCAQAIAFRRLLETPTTGRALAWTTLTALLLLAHYTSVVVGASQGLIYLLLHRRRTFATWPALVPFVPAAGWITWHWSFLAAMTMAPGSGGASIGPAELLRLPEMLFGVEAIGLLVIGGVLATLVLRRPDRASFGTMPERAVAASGLTALLLTLIGATVHLGFAPRYLTPVTPSLLFGLALWARWCLRVEARAVLAAFLVLCAGMTGLLAASLRSDEPDARHAFSFEPATAWLVEHRPKRLVFLWTDGVGEASPDRNVVDIAGFGFRRRGAAVQVTRVHPQAGRDTSMLARAAAGDEAAILWIANDRDQPRPTVPHIAEQDPRWTCRDFGHGYVMVTACRRQGERTVGKSHTRVTLSRCFSDIGSGADTVKEPRHRCRGSR